MSKEFFTLALLAAFSISDLIYLKRKFYKATVLVTFLRNLNSQVKGVEILANAISVPITNLNNIIIVIKILLLLLPFTAGRTSQ